jgi:chorismate synthase
LGDTFGAAFRLTTFGESHGVALGGVIEGCPPGLTLDVDALQAACDRRRPGTSKLVSGRAETDRVTILSGLDRGVTLGTPIAFTVPNVDADPAAYDALRDVYRPSHADFTWEARFGRRMVEGCGRASARETVARVVGGDVARQVLASIDPDPIDVVAWVDSVGDLRASVDPDHVTQQGVDASPVRCPDPAASAAFEARIREVRAAGDSVGGVVRVVARGVRAGLGAPVFDKLDADLAKALMSLPACKGVEVGSGFAGTLLTGRAHNDAFYADAGTIRTRTNRSGGVQGGISNGMPLLLAAAFKPVATIFHEQETVDAAGRPAVVRPRGRHDPCVLPRAVPIVEAMVWLVLADHRLRWRAQVGAPPPIPRLAPR